MKNQPRYQNNNPSQGNNRRRPVHEIRFGNIKAAVWENQNANGSWHSVSLSRSYKDGEEWRNVDSFGKDDLLVVAKVHGQFMKRFGGWVDGHGGTEWHNDDVQRSWR